jgi:hypothetical protein
LKFAQVMPPLGWSWVWLKMSHPAARADCNSAAVIKCSCPPGRVGSAPKFAPMKLVTKAIPARHFWPSTSVWASSSGLPKSQALSYSSS